MTSFPPLPRLLVLFALYAIPVLVTVQPVGHPILDPDIWWHLRVGQWVIEHRALPDADPFTQEGRPWVAYSWLYEVLVHGLYAAFGLHGILVYRVAMSLLVVAAIHALVRRVTRHFLASTGLTLAAVLAIQPLLYERPWLFTILFTTLTLHAVLELRQGTDPPRWVWALPYLFVIWVNVHVQFVYGLVVLALGCVAPLLDRALQLCPDEGPGAATANGRGWHHLLCLSALCLIATLVSPYHVRLYLVLIEYAQYTGAFRTVAELQAPEFREPASHLLLALALAAACCLGRRRLRSFDVLLLAGTALLAFRARRDLWFAVLAAIVLLARAAPREDAQPMPPLSWSLRGLGVGALALLALLVGWARGLSSDALDRTVRATFPVAAVEAIRERGYSGPLFNDFNWGGYLIWALPEMPVAIDGRTNLHGDDRLERYGRVWAGLPGWLDDPDLRAAGVILTPRDSPLASLLLLDKDHFEPVYEDDLARVFLRR